MRTGSETETVESPVDLRKGISLLSIFIVIFRFKKKKKFFFWGGPKATKFYSKFKFHKQNCYSNENTKTTTAKRKSKIFKTFSPYTISQPLNHRTHDQPYPLLLKAI